jgi:hypothetical protein
MPVRLHALAPLVLGNFRLASFLERAHSDFQIRGVLIQPSNAPRCNLVLCTSYEPLKTSIAGLDACVPFISLG